MIQAHGPAPYAPPAAVLGVIRRYRDHGLAVPFTPEVLERAGVTASLAPRTLQALKLLNLLDGEGHPTQELQDLEKSLSDEFKPKLAAVIRRAYEDVFAFTNPEQDTYDRIEDAFRSYTPKGQRGRMVTLFLGLCDAAGIKTPTGVQRGASEIAAMVADYKEVPRARRARKPRRAATAPRPSGGSQSALDLPPAVEGMLRSLPDPDEGWTLDQRTRFLAAFESVLDLSYPVKSAAEAEESAEVDSS